MSNKLSVVRRGVRFGALKSHFETSGDSDVKKDPGTHLETHDLLDHYVDESTSVEATHAVTDYVQAKVGRIPANTKISELRSKYKKLDHLLSAMLDVSEEPENFPSTSGTRVTLTGVEETSVQVGTVTIRNLTIGVDLGTWSTPPGGAAYTDPQEYYMQIDDVDVSKPKDQATVPLIFTLTTLDATKQVTRVWAKVDGTTVFNNKGKPYTTEGVFFTEIDAATYTAYAPVYIGTTPVTPSALASGVQSTDKVVSNTTVAYVPDYVHGNKLYFPRWVTNAHFWRSTGNTWNELTASNFSVAQVSKVVGLATLPYCEWTYNGTAHSFPRDMKFDLSAFP